MAKGNYWGLRAPKRRLSGSKCFGLAALLFTLVVAAPSIVLADESGISFWVPGLFGSLAAVPGQPGFTWVTTYYHTTVNARRDKDFEIGGRVVAGLDARADLAFLIPTYIFEQPVFGAQASVMALAICGRNDVAVSAILTGPRGNTLSLGRGEGLDSCGDLYPMGTLKWHRDNNNFMTYLTGDIPVGDYDPKRLVNLGLGHGAIDVGGGYTYFDEKNGHEFSAVMGFTYNFINPDTQVQSGVDFHLDWAASQFLSKTHFVGVVGYVYDQVSPDGGSGDKVGAFESRVIGVGPQIGIILPLDDRKAFINLKGYLEFDNQDRPDGWNAWVTFAFSPAPQKAPLK
jgi:hypothetical protein